MKSLDQTQVFFEKFECLEPPDEEFVFHNTLSALLPSPNPPSPLLRPFPPSPPPLPLPRFSLVKDSNDTLQVHGQVVLRSLRYELRYEINGGCACTVHVFDDVIPLPHILVGVLLPEGIVGIVEAQEGEDDLG